MRNVNIRKNVNRVKQVAIVREKWSLFVHNEIIGFNNHANTSAITNGYK